ncbi:hypothetical protein [Nocardia sp. NPDC051981]|uniref:hypothetical protein n=1 Tax=Nocardia sp. NPDC051981 TaxID=3155417 RepID=UPI003440B644
MPAWQRALLVHPALTEPAGALQPKINGHWVFDVDGTPVTAECSISSIAGPPSTASVEWIGRGRM